MLQRDHGQGPLIAMIQAAFDRHPKVAALLAGFVTERGIEAR